MNKHQLKKLFLNSNYGNIVGLEHNLKSIENKIIYNPRVMKKIIKEQRKILDRMRSLNKIIYEDTDSIITEVKK